jgi:hypothetical protein
MSPAKLTCSLCEITNFPEHTRKEHIDIFETDFPVGRGVKVFTEGRNGNNTYQNEGGNREAL